MKTNKLKILSITVCCAVTTLWSGTQCMEEKQVKQSDKKYKKRLFLGEADFSFTSSFLKKRLTEGKDISKYVTATELANKENLNLIYEKFRDNEVFLTDLKVQVIYEVDAREIHINTDLQDQIYPRIHFNFPHNKDNNSNMIERFFLSCSNLQNINDRVHISLALGDNKNWYEGYIYGIYDAAYKSRYQLIKKRKSPLERYPGYEHRETGADHAVKSTKNAREYIFEKVVQPENNPRSVYFNKFGKNINCLPQMDTDSTSSNYSTLSSSSSESVDEELLSQFKLLAVSTDGSDKSDNAQHQHNPVDYLKQKPSEPTVTQTKKESK